jgi:hypothetical protein
MTAARIQNLTRDRLHFVAQQHGGFHGSLFILEASTVLDQMLAQSFTGVTSNSASGTQRTTSAR